MKATELCDALEQGLAALRPEAAAGLRRHAPIELDGMKLEATFAPDRPDALAAGLGLVAERGGAVLVVGGGSRLAAGNPVERADLCLSTRALAGIEELDREEGVVRAGAGTPIAALGEAAAEAGWCLPLEPATPASTLGGTLAAAGVGPRATGLGRPRDAVLGLDVALADGSLNRIGARVVKNVTGYDLAKLHTGACGTLGVIAAVWLRLRPWPAAVSVLGVRLADPGQGLEVARRSSVRVAAVVAGAPARRALAEASGRLESPAGSVLLLVELAGDPAAVAHDRDWLAGRAGTLELGVGAVDALRDWQAEAAAPEEARVRFDVRAGRAAPMVGWLEAVLGTLPSDATEAGYTLHPALGLAWLRGPLAAAPESAAAMLDGWTREGRAVAGGHAHCDALPRSLRRSRDAFGPSGPGLALARSVKEQFDPGRVLNPGRFWGGL